MTTSIALRHTLRKIPELRSLTSEQLDSVMDQMVSKEYKAGEVLWRAGNHVDFLGVIQSGELSIEFRNNRSITRSARLTAGDYIKPRNLQHINLRSSVMARARSDVRLYVLRIEILSRIMPNLVFYDQNSFAPYNHLYLVWNRLWTVFVTLLILFLTQADLSRILSGILSIASSRTNANLYVYQDALGFLRLAETLDPDAAFAYNQEGYLWYQQNNSELAKAAYTNALVIDERNSPALNNLAALFYMEGQYQQSVTIQQKAVQSDPDRALIRYNFGLALASQDHNLEAVRQFKEATYIEPKWSLPYIQQAFIYLKLQDYMNAGTAASVAAQLDPAQQSAHLILAIALFNQNDNEGAIRSIEHALEISPADRVSLFYEALILRRLGEPADALLVLNQLFDSTDNSDEADRISAEITAIYLENPSLAIQGKEE